MAQYSDNFYDASKTAIGSHTPTSGAAWQTEHAANTFSDNHVRAGTTNLTRLRKQDDLGDDEMAVSCYGRTPSGTIAWGVCARMASGDYDNQYEAYLNPQTTLNLDKIVGGVRSSLGTATVTGDSLYHTLTLVIGNGTQKVYYDDELEISTTESDATLAGNEYAGLVLLGNGLDTSNVKIVWYHATTGVTLPTYDTSDPVESLVEDFVTLAAARAETIIDRQTFDQYPEKTADDNAYGDYNDTSNTTWTSGYFPSYLCPLYRLTNNTKILHGALARMTKNELRKTVTTDPDTGFQVGEPFYAMYQHLGIAYAVAPTSPILTTCASINTGRWQAVAGVYDHTWPTGQITVIADSHAIIWWLMWASLNGGSATLGTRAESHFAQGALNHIRADGSTYHMVEYSSATGEVLDKVTLQGYADESCWSRGQAWMMYGFTKMFELTEDTTYLTTARLLSDYTISRLPVVDKTPPWDFDDPALSNPPTDAQLDSSAGALMAWAFLLLSSLETNSVRAATYRRTGKEMLVSLLEHHLSTGSPATEAILRHAARTNGEHDQGLIYGDAYLIHALMYYMTEMPALSSGTRGLISASDLTLLTRIT